MDALRLLTVPEVLLTQNPFDYPRQPLPRYPRDLLEGVQFPEESFFTPAQQHAMFSREDESDDRDFYTQPRSVHAPHCYRTACTVLSQHPVDTSICVTDCRFLTHIDDEAIASLTEHYSRVLPSTPGGSDVAHLDMCSSWVSFLPADYSPTTCIGLGMNDAELAANKQVSRIGLSIKYLPGCPVD